MEFSLDPADIPCTTSMLESYQSTNQPLTQIYSTSRSSCTKTISSTSTVPTWGTEALSKQRSTGCGDMSADELVVIGTNDQLVLGTPSGEVTWRRRPGVENEVSNDQGIINPCRYYTRSSGEARASGVRTKALQGGTDGVGVHREFFDTRDKDYFGSVPIITERTLTDGIIDRCQVPIRELSGRDREPEGGNFNSDYAESGLLGVSGYRRREPWALGASRYRYPGPSMPDEWCRPVGSGMIPGDYGDVGRESTTDIPPRSVIPPRPSIPSRPPPATHQVFESPRNNLKPPTYDGTTELNSYITQFEMTSELNDWSYEKKALQLAVSLRGRAAEILNDIPTDRRRDYNLIIENLVDRFQPQNQRKLHVAKLRARIRRRNESLDDLANDIKKMTRLAYPDLSMKCKEEMALECFAEALNDDQLRRDLIVGGPKTMSEALRLATEAELSYSRRSHSYSRMIQDEQNDSLLRRIEELERCNENKTYQRIANIEDNSEKPNFSSPPGRNYHNKSKSKLAGVCYYCNAPGHIKRDCPLLKDPKNHPYNKYHNPQNRNKFQQSSYGTQNNNRNYQSLSRRNQGNYQ